MHNHDTMGKINFFLRLLAPCPRALGQFHPHGCLQELLIEYKKNEFNPRFEQNFTTGSNGVGIGCASYFQKACKLCSSLAKNKNWEDYKIIFTHIIQIAIYQFIVPHKFRD